MLTSYKWRPLWTLKPDTTEQKNIHFFRKTNRNSWPSYKKLILNAIFISQIKIYTLRHLKPPSARTKRNRNRRKIGRNMKNKKQSSGNSATNLKMKRLRSQRDNWGDLNSCWSCKNKTNKLWSTGNKKAENHDHLWRNNENKNILSPFFRTNPRR